MDRILSSLSSQFLPSEAERERMAEAKQRLLNVVSEELSVETTLSFTGSTARGTWVSGDHDIDLFIEFTDETDTARMSDIVLPIGKTVLDNWEVDFAAHPYIKGEFEGFEVDLVPCRSISTISEMETAVDRTPLHTEFMRDNLTNELSRDVVLLKQLLKANNLYGANQGTNGFSGFLVENLVLEHDGFRETLDWVADFQPPAVIDVVGHGKSITNDKSLVIVDPVDPTRNVAANLSADNVSRFSVLARRFLKNPDEKWFSGEDTGVPDAKEEFKRRGTFPFAIQFPNPTDAVDDTLRGQAERVLPSVLSSLKARDFRVFEADWVLTDDSLIFVIELFERHLPRAEHIRGPPVHMRDASERFEEEHALRTVFVRDGHMVALSEREVDTIDQLTGELLWETTRVSPQVNGEQVTSYVFGRTDVSECLPDNSGYFQKSL